MDDIKELPEPLTPADCDCTDLDGFMLNVERLMASELVALSTHETIGGAVLLWCRAWKQTPAASLPDDDRTNAAFAKMPLSRFKRIKSDVMRGFVKCKDGRLYHKTLSAEACRAYERKQAFRKKRETDAERLRKWRNGERETPNETRPETHIETQSETRFVAEGQGRGRDRDRDVLRDHHHYAGDAKPEKPQSAAAQDLEESFSDSGIPLEPSAKPSQMPEKPMKKSEGELVVEALLRADNGTTRYKLSPIHRDELARLCEVDGERPFREAFAIALKAEPRREGKGFVSYVAAVLGERAGHRAGAKTRSASGQQSSRPTLTRKVVHE